jgi:hypothetical protein
MVEMAGKGINKQGHEENEAREVHNANRVAKHTRECMQYLHYWFEAIYQLAISISIFLKLLLSLLEQP